MSGRLSFLYIFFCIFAITPARAASFRATTFLAILFLITCSDFIRFHERIKLGEMVKMPTYVLAYGSTCVPTNLTSSESERIVRVLWRIERKGHAGVLKILARGRNAL